MEAKPKANRVGRCMLKMQLPCITSLVVLKHFNEKGFVAKCYIRKGLWMILASLCLAILKWTELCQTRSVELESKRGLLSFFIFRDCFGVLDCEWCMVDSDGKTHLDKSYCAPQKECFGGIVGAKSPYVDDLGAIGNSACL